MSQKHFSSQWSCVRALAVLVTCCLFGQMPPASAAAAEVATDRDSAPRAAPSFVGVDFPLSSSSLVKQAADLGVSWVRRSSLSWAAVEPIEGKRNWQATHALENEFRLAAQRQLRVIVIVRDTPPWAQAHAGAACGPVRSDKLAAFGTFMREAVARFAKPPFNVLNYEIGNEPDVAIGAVPGDSGFGCWGNPADPYFGGRTYATALKAIYPQVKAASPSARVLVGGLLLDCDPSAPPKGRTCVESRFLEGILRAGGGTYFDAVSFHTYDFYGPVEGIYSNPNWASAWNTTGPALIRKVTFLRDALTRYGLTKPLLATELALVCWQCQPPPAEYERTKINYLPQVYAIAKAQNVQAGIWYSWEGWFGSNLVTNAGGSTPALDAFRVASAYLGQASFVRERTDIAGVRVYEFLRAGQRVWVMWPKDARTLGRAVTLPALPARMVDALGRTIKPQTTLILTAPVYVEWR